MAKYTRNPSKVILPGKLHEEIDANATITTLLDGVSYHIDGDILEVEMSGTLSGAEETELDVVIAAHSDVVTPTIFEYSRKKVGKYVDNNLLRSEIFEDATVTKICHEIEYSPRHDKLKIFFLGNLSGAEETALDVVIAAHDSGKYDSLRIARFMGDKRGTKLENQDYTIVGLTKASPFLAAGGRKATAAYFEDGTETVKVIEKEFSDYFEDTYENDYDYWKGIKIDHKFIKTDDSDGIVKSEKKPLNKEERGSMKIKRRSRAINGLIARAKDTPIEGMIDAIFDHYKSQMDTRLATGSSVLYDAMEAEVDATMLTYLGIVVGMPDYNGGVIATATVRDSIYQQINA